jgi:pimeloyl-ACP methyl ester carboxylesterase
MWHDFPAKVAEATDLRVLVYSRQGYGRSDKCNLPLPLTFMHHEGLDVLPELIKAAGIHEHILIGHSDGASISLIYGGGYPDENLRGIIVESPHVFCEDKTVQQIHKAKINYEQGNLRSKLTKYHGENVDCAFYGWNTAWLDPEFKKWNIEEYLPGINVPILTIQGTDDEYGTMEHAQRIEAKAGAGARTLVLTNCGHSPHKDKSDATLTAMTDFILQHLS